jgi:hypothetical protein
VYVFDNFVKNQVAVTACIYFWVYISVLCPCIMFYYCCVV